MSYWDDYQASMDEQADQDLGTVVAVLDGEGRYAEAEILELCTLAYEAIPDNWTPQRVQAVLNVDPLFIGQITEEIVETTNATLSQLHGERITYEGLAVRPRRVPAGWREGRAFARDADVGPNNQATYKTLPENAPARGKLRFGSVEEAKVYDALVVVQQRRPAETTLGVIPGCAFKVAGRVFWPDFVVVHRGRAAGIEVDGPHHHGRAAADHSRDSQLVDAGLLFVERIVVEDTTDPAELDKFVETFLSRAPDALAASSSNLVV